LKIFAFLANLSEKRPWLVVLVVAVITVFLLAGIPRIKTELNQESMMPKHYESVQAWKEVKDLFGGISYENALLVADDVSSPDVAATLLGLSPEKLVEAGFAEGDILKVETYLDFLKQLPEMLGLGNTAQGMSVDPSMLGPMLDFYIHPDPQSAFLDNMAAFMGYQLPEEAKEQLMQAFVDNSERIRGSKISEDGKAAIVSFQINPDLNQNQLVDLARKLEKFLRQEFSAIPGAEVYIAGNASIEKDAQDLMQNETGKLMIAAFVFVMLILYLTFRRFSDIALPLFIIMMAIFWILGIMGWVGITYTTMSVGVMPLMLGINIAYVIHILSRYYEEREKGKEPKLSATTSIKTVGVAVFLTAITTMIGFSSFMITDIPPMRDFGLLCFLGIGFSFLLSVTLLPAIIVLRDRSKQQQKLEAHLEKMRKRRREARYGLFIDRTLVRMAMLSERHHWWVAFCTGALIILAVFSMFNLKTGADVRSFIPENMPSMKASQMITKIFGPQDSDVIVVEGDVYDPANLAAMLSAEEAIASDERNVPGKEGYFFREGISSIADYIAKYSPGGTLPQSREQVEAVVAELSKNMPLGALVSQDGKAAMIMLRSGYPETEDELKTKTDIMRDASHVASQDTGLILKPTGMTPLVADLLGNIMPTQLKTSGLALLLCALILILVFKSLAYGIATLVVVVCGIMVEAIFLFAMGWPLDLMTVMVSSLIIGAGIDFGIHITHRFREEWHQNDTSLVESIRNTVLHVGRALVAAAFTTCGVFAILGISSMVMMQRFGFTTAVGLIGALLGAELVLPSMLAIVAKRQQRKAAPAAVSPTQPAGTPRRD